MNVSCAMPFLEALLGLLRVCASDEQRLCEPLAIDSPPLVPSEAFLQTLLLKVQFVNASKHVAPFSRRSSPSHRTVTEPTALSRSFLTVCSRACMFPNALCLSCTSSRPHQQLGSCLSGLMNLLETCLFFSSLYFSLSLCLFRSLSVILSSSLSTHFFSPCQVGIVQTAANPQQVATKRLFPARIYNRSGTHF